jgi:CRP-like cAMP-binding protein
MDTSNPGTAADRDWFSRLVDALQPQSMRADRLGSIGVFGGLDWPDLEFAAGFLAETLVERGTRMTVQGRPSSRLWIIAAGQALVSADARPLRVATRGDLIGGMTMLYGRTSPETALALTPIQAFEAGPDQFRELIGHRAIRSRLTAAVGVSGWGKGPARRRS